jgi:hypothetical protein
VADPFFVRHMLDAGSLPICRFAHLLALHPIITFTVVETIWTPGMGISLQD